MTPIDIYHQFITGMQQTTAVEYIAVVAGIVGVGFNWKANIWGYPIGLINTTLFIYLSIKGHLLGEATVNFYYTVMSVYGWMLWAKKDKVKHEPVLQITNSSRKEWMQHLLFFVIFYIVIFAALTWAKKAFAPEAIPWGDAFASATAYTGMWLMAKKKVESWIWWILTDIASVPLWFVKGYVFIGFQFAVLTAMAVGGLIEWNKRARISKNVAS